MQKVRTYIYEIYMNIYLKIILYWNIFLQTPKCTFDPVIIEGKLYDGFIKLYVDYLIFERRLSLSMIELNIIIPMFAVAIRGRCKKHFDFFVIAISSYETRTLRGKQPGQEATIQIIRKLLWKITSARQCKVWTKK
jgi:hypothetical protein